MEKVKVLKEVRGDHGWGLDRGMLFGLLLGLWCCLGFF